MPSQQIKPTDDGVELKITDENGDTYTVCFHVQPNEEIHIYSNGDGTFDIAEVASDGTERQCVTMDPQNGDTPLGK